MKLLLKPPFFALALLFGFRAAFMGVAFADAADAWNTPLPANRQAAHVLNRLAFGPRPGDVEAVEKMGVQKWIDLQMAPQNLDDRALESKVAALPTLQMSSERLLLALDGDQNGVFKEIRKLKQGREKAVPEMMDAQPADKATQMNAQIQAIVDKANPREQRRYQEYQASGLQWGTSVQALGELSADKLARATESNRQLQEVLTDFWSNHFNLDAKKGPVRVLKVADDRQVIRPRVFGTFRELLGASAKSPAMLFYLDNARSTKEFNAPDGKKRGGLNENYARELMELHTLGVEGGYTQKDVTEVARCLTGWSIEMKTGRFMFRPYAHDSGAKEVLGVQIPAGGGQGDGERVLDILANHPSTANFLARKLCVRFVGDQPPAALVTRVAGAFTQSKGDLKTTYRALFSSPEFWSVGAYRTKIKSPFEFVVSSVRALGGSYVLPNAQTTMGRMRLIAIGGSSLQKGDNADKPFRRSLALEIAKMGEPLWSCQPPTGYAEDSRTWVSSSALVARLNFALALTAGQLADVQLPASQPNTLDGAAQQLVSGDLSPQTRQTLQKEAPGDPARLRALILGAPEFQRR